MITVIESSEIISYIILQAELSLGTMEVPYRRIKTYAKCIESKRADIRVECDYISIDAFRCRFKQNMKFENGTIYIHNMQTLRQEVRRYLPSADITAILNSEDI